MNRSLLLVALLLGFGDFAPADEIKLQDGRVITGKVLDYRNGSVRIRDDSGQVFVSGIIQIESITFDGEEPGLTSQGPARRTKPSFETELQTRIEQAKKNLASRERPGAIIAMYAETEDLNDTLPQGYVEYRCYNGGGYSGIQRVPLRQAWTRIENIPSWGDGSRRIQLDPGPPYEVINREVVVVAGEVTNLGRVVLKKVKADGTASIHGVVRDTHEKPLPGVVVAAGAKQATTDIEGQYRLDGFGLSKVVLTAKRGDYFCAPVNVAIRDMSQREIERNLTLYRPHQIKLRYVISEKKSDSFEGQGVQQGVIERVVDSNRLELSGVRYSSSNFSEFAEETHLHLRLSPRGLTLSNFYAPIYFQKVDASVDFDSITDAGGMSENSQHCPALEKGSMVVIRGFATGRDRGVSEYCLKVLVEEMSPLERADKLEAAE